MYVLSDGKNYVMENPAKPGTYIYTTYSVRAKEFTYKQARSLVQNNRKKYSWMRNYHLVDLATGDVSEKSLNYRGNANSYDEDIEFNEGIFLEIMNETTFILNLMGWNKTQLNTYKNMLNNELSRCDSADSDIEHALQTYKEKTGGKKPQAHKMAKIGYLLDDIRDRHKKIKQCMKYLTVMEQAVDNGYSLEKLKLELSKAKYTEYKGRTKYYQMALDVLGGDKNGL
jgi:hypothetical protein